MRYDARTLHSNEVASLAVASQAIPRPFREEAYGNIIQQISSKKCERRRRERVGSVRKTTNQKIGSSKDWI